MNDSANLKGKHTAYLCLGSNIEPVKHLRQAIARLSEQAELLAVSTCWETEAIGKNAAAEPWPNFLNLGVKIATPLDPGQVKEQLIDPIEKQLGRVRGPDKYAPRTIDLDITIFDGQVLDKDIWRRVYLALIFAELLPGLRHPETGETIEQVAARLSQQTTATAYPSFA